MTTPDIRPPRGPPPARREAPALACWPIARRPAASSSQQDDRPATPHFPRVRATRRKRTTEVIQMQSTIPPRNWGRRVKAPPRPCVPTKRRFILSPPLSHRRRRASENYDRKPPAVGSLCVRFSPVLSSLCNSTTLFAQATLSVPICYNGGNVGRGVELPPC